MENLELIEQYAPWILIILIVIWQNNIFVRPEQLEKKHREILVDVKKDFVELNAYREFQSHVLKEIEGIKDDINENISELKEILKCRRSDDRK